MANLIYNTYRQEELNDTVNVITDTIKVMLVTSTYSPLATHSKRNQVTNEVSGAGYTAGGITLTGKSISLVGTQARFIASNVTWSTATITARGAVIYKDTGNATTDNLIGYVDFVTDQSSTNGNFTINWSASGVLTLS